MKQTVLFFTCILAFSSIAANAQTGDPDSLLEYHIQAHATDNNIPFELGAHYVWFNPTCPPQHLLLLHMPGTYDIPANTTYFPELAANNGYNTIVLRYPNDTSAQQSCRLSSDVDCYEDFRREILEGVDYSPNITVDSIECVYNRLLKLLIYLDAQHPTQGWNYFYSGNTINWANIVVSGHSQGGGHAALIAKDHQVHGVLTFASPNDYSVYFNGPANWTTLPHVTPDSCYFGFANLYDDIVDFPEQYVQWTSLDMDAFGDTICVNSSFCPYSNSHMLVTHDTVGSFSGNHNLVVRDAETPLDAANIPVYVPVWEYMLRLPCLMMNTPPAENQNSALSVYPVPADEMITMDVPGSSVENGELNVYDLSGRLVMQTKNIQSPRITFSVEGWTPGMYFAVLTDGSATAECKLIVE